MAGPRTWALVAAASMIGAMAVAAPAAATTKQVTVLPPQDGKVYSSPDEPHHTPYDGDYSFDVGGGGAVYARFRNPTGALSLTVAMTARACASGSFADGGDRIALNVLLDGAKVGTVTYAHMTRFAYGVGATVPVGARIGDAVTSSDGVVARAENGCWGGPHVHVEPRNDVKYGCYFAGLLNTTVTSNNPFGIVGGEWATGKYVVCPANAEGGGGGGGSPTTTVGSDGANLRADTNTQAAIIRTIPAGATIPLECWRRGEAIQRSTGSYSLWHQTTYSDSHGYVSDSTLNTPAFPNPGADQPAAGERACEAAQVSPKIGVTPTTGDRTTLFQGSGAGFTPGSTASLTAYQPNGTEYGAAYTRTRTVDGSGNFSWTWRWDPGDADGTYRFVFKDSTGPTAETQLTILAPSPSPSPTSTPSTQPGDPVLGFDAMSAPPLSTMQAWTASPYRAVGVYIPVRASESDDRADKAQTNLTPSWVQSVSSLGYAVVPVYFGKQAPLACSSNKWWNMSGDVSVARQQGLTAASDADASADGLGIAASAPIVYDLEPFSPGCEAAVTAFLSGWTEGLHSAGRVASVYGSESSTMTLLRNASSRPSPAPDTLWVATDNGQANTSSLGSSYSPWSGHLGNQYRLDVAETYGGVALTIDRNAFDRAALALSGPGTSTSPSPTSSTVLHLSTSTPDIQPNQQARLTVTGADTSPVDLRCYSQPSTTYVTARTVTPTSGRADFSLLPGTNTRCFAVTDGAAASASSSVVVNVHTTLSLSVYQDGPRSYHFQGRNLPRRSGQLITLYRIEQSGAQVRTATANTSDTGIWRIDRTFTGAGAFTFVARASQTMINGAGVSNRRALTVR